MQIKELSDKKVHQATTKEKVISSKKTHPLKIKVALMGSKLQIPSAVRISKGLKLNWQPQVMSKKVKLLTHLWIL